VIPTLTLPLLFIRPTSGYTISTARTAKEKLLENHSSFRLSRPNCHQPNHLAPQLGSSMPSNAVSFVASIRVKHKLINLDSHKANQEGGQLIILVVRPSSGPPADCSQIADLAKESLGDIVLTPNESNIFVWRATLPGPQGSPYEGGLFDVDIRIPENYPYVI
jgi:hypothetical protein